VTGAPQAPASELFALTSREREIVTAVAQGYANKQIATALTISTRTVENHLRNIYEKLHINTRTQLLSILHRRDYNSAGPAAE
jgi:DNA-binding NarL/FixJ family response regulator